MQNDKRHLTYLLILLSIAILLFFTKGAYSDLQVQISEKEGHEEKIEKLEKEKKELGKIKTDMSDPNSTIRKDISRYVNDFTEHDMLSYFYAYSLNTGGKFTVTSMSLNKKDVNEYGFQEGDIDLSVSSESEKDILNFLEKILDEDAPYRFFIEKFDLPKKVDGRNMELSIPLKIFYK